MIETLAIAGYRSLRDLVVPLRRLTIVTGPNGSGKSSLYRALRLLAETAQGGLIPSLAREGGLPSTLWAGPESISRAMKVGRHSVQGTPRQAVVSLRLGFGSEDYGYAIDLGLPPQKPPSAFRLDPEIKQDCIWAGPVLRPAGLMVDRRGPSLRAQDGAEGWQVIPRPIATFESMMTAFADPRDAPEMITVRERLRGWRFYDAFRTDPEARVRQPQIGTHTPVLGHDGTDLAAALQTIREIGDDRALDDAIADAFSGATVAVACGDGRFEVVMQQPGLLRSLTAAELSDGTLRYLLLVAALLTPRPPGLMVLNEPETSLHPSLIPPLGRLIGAASERSQVIVVTHNAALLDALTALPDAFAIALDKQFGETIVTDLDMLDRPRWEWPAR